MRHSPAACSVDPAVVLRLFRITKEPKCFSTRASRLAVADGFGTPAQSSGEIQANSKAEVFVDLNSKSALNAAVLLRLVLYYSYVSRVLSYEAPTTVTMNQGNYRESWPN